VLNMFFRYLLILRFRCESIAVELFATNVLQMKTVNILY
jgi:hypothetical protein